MMKLLQEERFEQSLSFVKRRSKKSKFPKMLISIGETMISLQMIQVFTEILWILLSMLSNTKLLTGCDRKRKDQIMIKKTSISS